MPKHWLRWGCAAHVGRERCLLGQLCWAWAVASQDQNTKNTLCRRKDTSALRNALHKTFHSLRQGRRVPRADNERRVWSWKLFPSCWRETSVWELALGKTAQWAAFGGLQEAQPPLSWLAGPSGTARAHLQLLWCTGFSLSQGFSQGKVGMGTWQV